MSVEKRSVGKGQIIHTSLKPMTSVESDFTNSEPTPGVLARAVYHHDSQEVVVEIYHESPLIISPGKGEFINADPDTVDNVVRSLIINIAQKCKVQAEELLQHADRLLEIASQENIIDEIDKERVKEKAGYAGGLIDSSSSSRPGYNVATITSSSKEKVKQGRPRIKGEDLLSMLAEDDEGEEDMEGTGLTESREVEEEEDVEREDGEQEEDREDDNLLDCLLEED